MFFQLYLEQFGTLAAKAKRRPDKGMYLYRNGLRTVLFQLEALCRLFRNSGDKRFFDMWYKEFKALEDTLGAMEYHESVFNEFNEYASWKKTARELYGKRFDEEAAFFSDVLQSHRWLDGAWIKAFAAEAEEHLPPAAQTNDFIAREIIKEWEKVLTKLEDGSLDMMHVESGIHELRRRVRWISIYTGALQGRIALHHMPISDRWKHYCAKNILELPYNQLMPAHQEAIYIQPQHFYALSWLVLKLGEWKDVGLRAEALHTLLEQSGKADKKAEAAFLKACSVAPGEVSMLAEEAVDEFVHHYRVPQRWIIDLRRAMNQPA